MAKNLMKKVLIGPSRYSSFLAKGSCCIRNKAVNNPEQLFDKLKSRKVSVVTSYLHGPEKQQRVAPEARRPPDRAWPLPLYPCLGTAQDTAREMPKKGKWRAQEIWWSLQTAWALRRERRSE